MIFNTEEQQPLRQWQLQQQQPMKVQRIDHDDDTEHFADSTSASGATTSEYDSDGEKLQQPMKVHCFDHDDGTGPKMLFDREDVAESTSASGATTSECDSDDVSDEKLKNVGSVLMNFCTVDMNAEVPQMPPPPGLFPVRPQAFHQSSGDSDTTQPYCNFDTINAGHQFDRTYFHGDPSFMQDPLAYNSMYLHPGFSNSHCYGTGFKTGVRNGRPAKQQRKETPWTLIWVSEQASKRGAEATAKVFETLGCQVKQYRTSSEATIALRRTADISNTILLASKEQAPGMANFLMAWDLVQDVPLVVLDKPFSAQHSCEDAMDTVKAISVQYGFA